VILFEVLSEVRKSDEKENIEILMLGTHPSSFVLNVAV